MLEKEHGIVVTNGGLDEALGVIRCSRTDDFKARVMHEPHFWILRVEGATVDMASAGPAQDERHGRSPEIVGLGDDVGDLIEGAADKVHELVSAAP